MDRLVYGVFRVVAIAEAFSWLGLLIGMYVKYFGGGNTLGVAVFGPIHGALFVIYGLSIVILAYRQRWKFFSMTFVGLACSIPPFASLWFERRVSRFQRTLNTETQPTEIPVTV